MQQWLLLHWLPGGQGSEVGCGSRMVHSLGIAAAANVIHAHGHCVRRAAELLRAELLHLRVSKRRFHLLAGRRSVQGTAGGHCVN